MKGRLALDDVDQFGGHVKLKKECLFLETHSCIHSNSKLLFILCCSKCTNQSSGCQRHGDCLGVYHRVLKNLALFNEKEIKRTGKMTSFSNQSKTPKESSSTLDNPKDY